jgi:peptidoglycan/LPS O-acetylase OafA/YrhL
LKPETSLVYRPEIDGLRAVAVLSVVVFHGDLALPGGYVGVDVFFVISGFLITSLVLRDLREQRFRLVDFWERRARRILPALMPAAIAALLLSILFLPPAALVSAAQSTAWLGAFASNVFFCNTLDYFSAPAEAQPLLHTWSLAVEEQFYVFFPPFLVGAFALVKRSVKGLFAFVVLFAGASLAASLVVTNTKPTLAFYLLHTRAFELLLGAIIAFIPAASMERLGRLREVLSIAGLGLIAFACMRFTRQTPFPGKHALVPCIGAALFIVGNMGDRARRLTPVTWSGRALALRPVVFVGLVSYSFYLWHWLPLAIANHWHFATNQPLIRASFLVGAFVCAVLSWRYIERPFRKPSAHPRRLSVALFAALSMGSLIAGGTAIAASGGTISRVPPSALAWLDAKADTKFMRPTDPSHVRYGSLPVFGVEDPDVDPTVLIWGDSHAMVVASAVDTICRETGRSGYLAVHSSTAPVRGVNSWGPYALNEQSIPYAEAVFDFIQRKGIREVVLIAYWSAYFDEYQLGVVHTYDEDSYAIALLRTIKDLQALGVRVIFQRQVPNYQVSVPEELAWRALFGQAPTTGNITLNNLRIESLKLVALERDVVATGATIVDAVSALSTPEGTPMVASDGKSFYGDSYHLSAVGGARLVPAYRAAFADVK